MPADAKVAPREETAAILHCLHESLREPRFIQHLARLLLGNGRTGRREFAGRLASGASGQDGEGVSTER